MLHFDCRLFNPQSFLTAVRQVTARRNDWPLSEVVLITEVQLFAKQQFLNIKACSCFVVKLLPDGAGGTEDA